MRSLFALPVSKLDELSTGSVVNTITTSSNSIQMSISDKLSMMLQSLALLVAAYAIAFRYSWALTLVASAPLLFILALCSITIPIIHKAQQRVDKADEKHVSIAAETFGSIRTVSSLGAEKSQWAKYVSWTGESKNQGLRMSLILGMHVAPIFFAMYVNYALTFWFGLKLYQEGHIGNIKTVIM